MTEDAGMLPIGGNIGGRERHKRMGANTKIEWCDFSFNPWRGCTKVSPGCDHCYAEGVAHRFKMAEWGPGKPRQLASDDYWNEPLKWNKKAEAAGVRQRVFCASLADVFDNEVDPAWRIRLFALIEKTSHLDWLLLTKRIGNVTKMLPMDWGKGWPNVWLGISVVNQEEADRDIPKLLTVDAKVRFLSMEPLLGPVDLHHLGGGLTDALRGTKVKTMGQHNAAGNWHQGIYAMMMNKIDWVIVGGESGRDARPMQREWVTSLRDQCIAAGVPFFLKQWGEWGPILSTGPHDPLPYRDGMVRFGKKLAGRTLDGREWNEFPLAA